VALADATASFREISAHVNVPGDRTRAVAMSLHGGFR